MSTQLARFLFLASCATVLVGGGLGLRELPWDFEPPSSHPAWVARYESVSAGLAGESEALYVQEGGAGGSHRYFRAQFVLLPVIVKRQADLDAISSKQLLRSPLILDFYTRKGLRETLRRLNAEAGAAGLELEIERGRGQLALVRARKAGA